MNKICKKCEWSDHSYDKFLNEAGVSECIFCHGGSHFSKRVTYTPPKPLADAEWGVMHETSRQGACV